MIKRRELVACIILSIVTCGIYGIYWFVCLNDEINIASEQPGQSGVVVILLSLVTCGIYFFIWSYKAGEKMDIAKTKRNMPAGNSGVLYLILALFQLSIVTYALIQNDLNTMAEM